MKRLLFIFCITFSSLISVSNAQAQMISKEMLPDIVKVMNAQFPQKLDEAVTLTKCELRNSNSEMVFSFEINPSVYGVSSSDFISSMDAMTPDEKKNYLGKEFNEIAKLIPVPIYGMFIFPNGQKYNLLLTD